MPRRSPHLDDIVFYSIESKDRNVGAKLFLALLFAASICLVMLKYFPTNSLGNMAFWVVGAFVLVFSYLSMQQTAILRIGTLHYDGGLSQTTIAYDSISEFSLDTENNLHIKLRDGTSKVIAFKKFEADEVAHFHQMLHMILSVHQKEGALSIPMFSKVEIDTERLHIRPAKYSDRHAISAMKLADSNQRYQLYHPTPDHLSDEINDFNALANGNYPLYWTLAITDKQTSDYVGELIFWMSHDTFMKRAAEIGISIVEERQSQGYASEAIAGLLDYAKEHTNINKATASCFAHNTACAKAMQRAGLTQVGRQNDYWVKDGEWVDSLNFEILLREDDNETSKENA